MGAKGKIKTCGRRPPPSRNPKSQVRNPFSPDTPDSKASFPHSFLFIPKAAHPHIKNLRPQAATFPTTPTIPVNPDTPDSKVYFPLTVSFSSQSSPPPHIKKLRPQAASFPHPASRTPHPVFFKSPRKKAPQRGAAFTYHFSLNRLTSPWTVAVPYPRYTHRIPCHRWDAGTVSQNLPPGSSGLWR